MTEPRAKGPRIFLDYDQAELDAAYNQAAYAPNMELVHQCSEANSAAVRERLGAPLRLAYGETEFERLDLYRTKRPQAPIFVFIHGGAWRGGSASRSATPAEMFVDHGAHYIALDFILIDARSPEVYAQEHVPGAVNLWHRHMSAETTARFPKDKLLVTYCAGVGCNASTKGALKLAALGFRVKEMIGGIEVWKSEGYGVEKGKPV